VTNTKRQKEKREKEETEKDEIIDTKKHSMITWGWVSDKGTNKKRKMRLEDKA